MPNLPRSEGDPVNEEAGFNSAEGEEQEGLLPPIKRPAVSLIEPSRKSLSVTKSLSTLPSA